MPKFKLEQFGGMLPAWDDRLLPAGQAGVSVNAYTFSGALTGWRQPKKLRDLTNPSAKMAYRVPVVVSGKAGAYLEFLGNPQGGDTVKVGEEIYTFTATVTKSYDVLIGASAQDSANNLFAALTIGSGEGTLYGSGTCPNPVISTVASDNFVNASPLYIRLQAPDIGAAFNTTAVSESTNRVRLIWLSSVTGPGLPITATYTGGLNSTFDSSIGSSSTWLEFTDADTDVLKSPIVDDSFNRFYFACPSLPPKYNVYDRITAGLPAWLLGVNPPGCAPIVSVTGGGDTAILGVSVSTDASSFSLAGEKIYLVKIKPTAAEQLDSLSFMPSVSNAAVHFAAVLYDDLNGKPNQLQNVGEIITGVTAATEANSPFTNPTGLLANTPYWIGIMVDDVISFQGGDNTNNADVFDNTFSNGPPEFAPTNPTTGIKTPQLWGNLTTDQVLEARAYLYTWVTAYGEEGPPSPPTTVTGWANGTWSIGLYTPPPDEMGVTRNITSINLYRTVPSLTGQATYFLVANIPVGTLTYTDIITDDVVALNTQLPSTNWFPPPEGLQGMCSMPNGMIVGFKGNELWFCEPYRPHAWPPNYVQTTEFPIIGIGVVGQSVVAATSSNPYYSTGVNPASMAMNKLPVVEPCISRRSVLGTEKGVYYHSPNGLIQVTAAGAPSNITEMWVTRDKWAKLVPAKNVRAIQLSGCYFAFGSTNGSDVSVAQQGYFVELADGDAQSFTIWPQPGGHRIGFNQLTAPNNFNIDNLLVDPWTGYGIVIQNAGVYYYDFTDQAPVIVPYKWRSKKYQQTSKKNFEVMKIYFDIPPGSPALNPVRNTAATSDASWNTLAANQYGIVRVYADDILVTTREIRSSAELLRILSGFKADTWQWEFEGRVQITNMQAATSVKELGQV